MKNFKKLFGYGLLIITLVALVPSGLLANTIQLDIAASNIVNIKLNPDYPGDTFWFAASQTNFTFPPNSQSAPVQIGTLYVQYSDIVGSEYGGEATTSGFFNPRNASISGINVSFTQGYSLQVRGDADTLIIDPVTTPMIFDLPTGDVSLTLQGLSIRGDALGYFTAPLYGDLTFTPVPEPATMLLLGLGLIGVAGIRRKFKK